MRCGLPPLIFYEPWTSGRLARHRAVSEAVNPGEVLLVAVWENIPGWIVAEVS